MAQMIRLTCPECGNTMDVPSELEEFSCLYCGKRARTAAIKALNENAEATYAQLRAELRQKLPAAVTNYPDYHKKITKKDFFPHLRSMRAKIPPFWSSSMSPRASIPAAAPTVCTKSRRICSTGWRNSCAATRAGGKNRSSPT